MPLWLGCVPWVAQLQRHDNMAASLADASLTRLPMLYRKVVPMLSPNTGNATIGA